MLCLVGWKFCKRWSVARPYCCYKQCFWSPWIYSQGFIQSMSNISWTGIQLFLLIYVCALQAISLNIQVFILKKKNVLDICITQFEGLFKYFHQETLVRVAVWCIGEYGDMLVNNVGMFEIENPITVSIIVSMHLL